MCCQRYRIRQRVTATVNLLKRSSSPAFRQVTANSSNQHTRLGVSICRTIISFARVYRVGVWFRFVRSALLLAVVTYVVLLFEVMPGLCCFVCVTHGWHIRGCTQSSCTQSSGAQPPGTGTAVYRDAPACTWSSGSQPPGTCTHTRHTRRTGVHDT